MTDKKTISELSPLTSIKETLDGLFGKSAWKDWEPETILLELGIAPHGLLLDKISVLKLLESNPQQILDDPILFLYSAEAMNNSMVDFENVPHITMLEAAWALWQTKKILSINGVVPVFGAPIIKVCEYILKQDGASVALPPFEFVPQDLLEKGQTKEDTEAKGKAIISYISHMEAL